jgi:hypothetical protein
MTYILRLLFGALAGFLRGLDDANRPRPVEGPPASPEPEAGPAEVVPELAATVRHQGPFAGHPDLFATPARRQALAHHVAMTTHGPAKLLVKGTTAGGYEFAEFAVDAEAARS